MGSNPTAPTKKEGTLQIFSFATKNKKELVSALQTNLTRGLTPAQARLRLEKRGRNEVKGKPVSVGAVLARQFKSPFLYLLAIAAGVSFVLGENIQGIVVVVFVCINAGLSFVQEFHSENILRELSRYVESSISVIREDDVMQIPSSEIVPGDLVVLESGNKIPADVRFLSFDTMRVDESVLTGESVAIDKVLEPMRRAPRTISKALNLGFAGSTVLAGKGIAVVVATGRETQLGGITELTVKTRHRSTFEKNLSHLSNALLLVVVGIVVLLFLAHMVLHQGVLPVHQMLLFSIAIAVTVIPESLPTIMTFSLSRGAVHLAKEKVVVKRLSAIEDLGGIEVLCTDKTGTITENVLTVEGIFSGSGEKVLEYANIAASANDRMRDPFDRALWNRLSAPERSQVGHFRVMHEVPFHPNIRRNIVYATAHGSHVLITRGAFETVSKLCVDLTAETRSHLRGWIAAQEKRGRRVLVLATKSFPLKIVLHPSTTTLTREKNFEFAGAISFIDPIKTTAHEAVAEARRLGVSLKIITGDSAEVARAVALDVGILDDIDGVITGEKFQALSPKKRLAAVERYSVFARFAPDQKYRVVELLQRNHEVGYLGDGVNDAPALKLAGVSLVVHSAADVAKEAADIVLLNKSLKVVVDGIREGREVFSNTVTYIKATLISNIGNFLTISVVSLFLNFLPLLPLQILLVNLITDFPMLALATDRVRSKEIHRPRKYDIKNIVRLMLLLGLISNVFDLIFFATFRSMAPSELQTAWFIMSILTELALLFSIRTEGFFLFARRPSRTILGLTVLAIAAALTLPFTVFGHQVFSFVSLTSVQIFLLVCVVYLYFVASEGAKLLYYRLMHWRAKKALRSH